MERFFKSCIFFLVEVSCLECGIVGNIKVVVEVFLVGIVSFYVVNIYYLLWLGYLLLYIIILDGFI